MFVAGLDHTMSIRGADGVERTEMTGRLILLCGVAGAGKTTLAKELRFLDAPVAVLTARVEGGNRALPEGAPRIGPRLVAYWADRIERPDPEELSFYDSPTIRPSLEDDT